MKWVTITPNFYLNLDAYDQFLILDNEDRGIENCDDDEWHLFGVKGEKKILIDIWYFPGQAEKWLKNLMSDFGEIS